MKLTESLSLLEFLFNGSFLTNIFIGLLFFLGFIALYSFFLKYLYLKEISNKENDFLANIADCIYDQRIDSAKDLCKRVSSPESRIIKKGLDKIGNSSFEMFVAVVNQREIEVLGMRKNLFKFELLAKIILLIGVLGTGISLISFFAQADTDLFSLHFYTTLIPISIGALLGLFIYLFKMILVSRLHSIEVDLKTKGNKFLEIVAETK